MRFSNLIVQLPLPFLTIVLRTAFALYGGESFYPNIVLQSAPSTQFWAAKTFQKVPPFDLTRWHPFFGENLQNFSRDAFGANMTNFEGGALVKKKNSFFDQNFPKKSLKKLFWPVFFKQFAWGAENFSKISVFIFL